ncbi:ParB/RepB/Spo0J family partition protein [Bradyrhizobium sp. Ash2021]|uniref:ParB/RepB/Spo0J family partition protein n=1 Tax=Bradyrhizobium sp. Ash2021 TaxID=2954771 RepID=UPI0028155528|nr:ParB/RepB/Spo0J family partition protein [Bradyrhizobium sp. Ash2021]WMT79580.1 ParB/RepB/Spo0J family partition protein [Bradyrhizobium sp. Ash2021]
MTLDLSFKELVDAAANPNAATGRPLLVAIDCIDEDPDQPRRNFSEQELEELSQSIGEHGVLQPIMLRRSNEVGRYVIVMGARRYRAAQRAGLREMPAFVQEVGLPDRYAQMIENIQRDDLRAPEIALFIADRLDAGDTQADIARKLGKPRDWVSRYASVQSMPEFLRARLEGSSIRALYELYQAWRTHPGEIERLCATQDSFTDAQARQLARDVRAAADRANAQDQSPAGPPRSERCDLLPEAVLPRAAAKGREAATDHQPPKTRVVSQSAASLAIRVRYQNRAGQLVVDRLATQGSRHAVVLVDGADHAEEVPASALTIEEILSR